MTQLTDLTLHNIGMYESAHLDLGTPGLTVIYGHNKDANSDNRKSNGSGKSMLLTAMAETAFNSSPMVRGTATKRDLLTSKDSRCTVGFETGGVLYRVSEYLDGKTVKYDLERQVGKEWKPTKVRTNAYVLSKLWELMPITEEEFYTFFYVDSLRSAALQRASHNARRNFFTSAFRLDTFDTVKGIVGKKRRALAEKETQLTLVQSEIRKLEQELDGLDVTEDSADVLVTLRKRQQKLADKQATLQRSLRLSTIRATCLPILERSLRNLKVLGHDGYDVEGICAEGGNFILEVSEACTTGIRNNKKKLRQLEQSSEWLARRNILQERFDDTCEVLHKKYAKFDGDLTGKLSKDKQYLEGLREEAANAAKKQLLYRAELAKLDAALAEATLTKSELAVIDRLSETYGDTDLDEAVALRAEHQARVTALKEQLTPLTDLLSADAAHCPTCQSSLNVKALAKLRADLEASIAKHSDRVTFTTKVQKGLKELTALREKARTYDNISDSLQELSTCKPSEPDVDIAEVDSLLTTIEQAMQLRRELADLDEDMPEDASNLDVALIQRRQEAMRSTLNDMESLKPHAGVLAEMWKHGVEDTAELEETLSTLRTQMLETMDRISRLSAHTSVAQNLALKLSNLQEQEAELAEGLSDLPVLKLLEQTYSDKGLKHFSLQRICKQVESNLNLCAPLLFSEPIKFQFKLDATNLHILAVRQFQGSMKTVDVRRLSAAESAAFNELLPMAMLPLLPASRRLNVMILDEPTAHMDEPGIELFCTKFLPRLLRIVPHVIVMSPTPLPIGIDHRKVTVVREGGVSQLVDSAE